MFKRGGSKNGKSKGKQSNALTPLVSQQPLMPTHPKKPRTERVLMPGNKSAPVISGMLGDVISHHAYERARHFFLFCTYVNIARDYLEKKYPGALSKPELGDIVKKTATHQIGIGYQDAKLRDEYKEKFERKEIEWDYTADRFEKTSLAILSARSTGLINTDAAHFNNLGLNPGFLSSIEEVTNNNPQDIILKSLKNSCIDTCANTMTLPKHVNIGPDKIIDGVHGEVFDQITTKKRKHGHAFVSDENTRLYTDVATTKLDAWAAKGSKSTQLAQAVKPYKEGFAIAGISLYNDIYPEVQALIEEIKDHGVVLDVAKYLGVAEAGGVARSESSQELIDRFQSGPVQEIVSKQKSSEARDIDDLD